jgi:hypothetical protein
MVPVRAPHPFIRSSDRQASALTSGKSRMRANARDWGWCLGDEMRSEVLGA